MPSIGVRQSAIGVPSGSAFAAGAFAAGAFAAGAGAAGAGAAGAGAAGAGAAGAGAGCGAGVCASNGDEISIAAIIEPNTFMFILQISLLANSLKKATIPYGSVRACASFAF